jgi:hypothetical protein
MEDPLSQLEPGRGIAVHLSNGQICRGQVGGLRGPWLHLTAESGGVLVNLTQVTAIVLDAASAPEAMIDIARPKPRSKDEPIRAGSKALGRAWADAELKALADAFLDGLQDGELAERFHRSRSQITELHQAFECARGNLVEDQLRPVARTWVARWRKALAP